MSIIYSILSSFMTIPFHMCSTKPEVHKCDTMMQLCSILAPATVREIPLYLLVCVLPCDNTITSFPLPFSCIQTSMINVVTNKVFILMNFMFWCEKFRQKYTYNTWHAHIYLYNLYYQWSECMTHTPGKHKMRK